MTRGIGLHRRTLAPGVSPGVTFRAAVTNSNVGFSTAIIIPASVQVGDMMLLAVTSIGPNAPITSPSGWNVVRHDLGTGSIFQSACVISSRVAQAGDASSTVTIPYNGGGNPVASLVAYSGSSGVVSQQGASVSSADATTVPAPSVTTTINNSMVLDFFSSTPNSGNNPPTMTPPATNRVNLQFSSTGSFVPGQCVSEQLQAVAGVSSGQSMTTTPAGSWCGQTVVIHP